MIQFKSIKSSFNKSKIFKLAESARSVNKKRSEVGLYSTRRRITESERRGKANRGLKGGDAAEQRRDAKFLIMLKMVLAAERLKMGFRVLEKR